MIAFISKYLSKESMHSLAITMAGPFCIGCSFAETTCFVASKLMPEYQQSACLLPRSRSYLQKRISKSVWFPSREGQHPLVILLHGSSGPATGSMMERKDFWLNNGYAVMLLDSFNDQRVEDYCETFFCHCPLSTEQDEDEDHDQITLEDNRQQMMEDITDGAFLLPTERAVDLLLALVDARKIKRIQPDNIHLLGFSHGGSAILEAFTMVKNRIRLAHMDFDFEAPLEGVRSASVYYPNCIAGTYFNYYQSTPANIPVFMALAEYDEFVSAPLCEEIANIINAPGMIRSFINSLLGTYSATFKIETFPYKHAFDSTEYPGAYDPSAKKQLWKKNLDFVRKHSSFR